TSSGSRWPRWSCRPSWSSCTAGGPAPSRRSLWSASRAASSSTPRSTACTRYSPMPTRRTCGRRAPVLRSASAEAARCWRRSWPDSCSRAGCPCRSSPRSWPAGRWSLRSCSCSSSSMPRRRRRSKQKKSRRRRRRYPQSRSPGRRRPPDAARSARAEAARCGRAAVRLKGTRRKLCPFFYAPGRASSKRRGGQISNAEGQAASGRRHELGVAWTEQIGQTPLEFQPGSRWAYSALAGFDVLSRIVEVASGQTFDAFLRERVFGPLGMRDTTFWPTSAQRERLASSYVARDGQLVPRPNPDSMSGERYFSAAGGLMTTAEDYARFAMMLANDGELDGVRILSPRSVEMMRSIFVPDTVPGRQPGEAFGLGVRVIENPAERRTWLSEGSFGWSGAYGTHFWVSPRERLVAILLAQTSVRALRDDFETAVMQAVAD